MYLDIDLLIEEAESEEGYRYSDRFKFGLTFSHAINRLMTASLTDHTLENTRKALAKTVADCDSPKDIQFLRRDMVQGKSTMAKRSVRHKDPEERAQAQKHLTWLETEYAKMLTARLREIQSEE